MLRLFAFVLACAALSAGCGSASVQELPPPASAADAPPLETPPAGRVVEVGGSPEGVAVDPRTRRVAVGLHGVDQLALLDADTGQVRERVDLPAAPRHVATGPDGDFLVPAHAADRLLRVRARDGRVISSQATGAGPHDAVAARDRIFVSDEGAGTLTVLRPDRPPGVVPVHAQPGGVAGVDGGSAIAIVSMRARSVELLDAGTLERIGRVPAGVGPTHIVSEPRWNRLYVTDTQAGALLVFVTRPELELVRRVYMPGGPYGITVDTRRQRLWVTMTETNEVAELPAHGRPHVLRTLPTVRQPNTVAVDESSGRLFVTGRHAGVVQLIDP